MNPVIIIAFIGIIYLMTPKKLNDISLKYREYFKKAEEKFGVNRYLLNAIMLHESGGKPDAINRKGEYSVGLMQLNISGTLFESKQKLIKKYLGKTINSMEEMLQFLMNPENNILTATALIYDNRQLKSNNEMQDLALYNGGWNAVKPSGDIEPTVFQNYVIPVLGIKNSLMVQDGILV